MRRLVLLSVVAALVGAQPAAAQQIPPITPDPCGYTTTGDAINCVVDYAVNVGQVASTLSDAAVSMVSDVNYVDYDRLDINGGVDGGICSGRGYRPEAPASGPPLPGEFAGEAVVDAAAAGFPACPVQATEEAAAGQPGTPQAYAARFLQEIPLPQPQPRIAPGRAITGMFAYLETRGSTTHSYTEPNTPFGPLQIQATGAYYVDWGDGTHTGPYPDEGGPWPDGRITHEYLRVGAYDVVVTERWTATWSFGSESGTLDELRTVGRIDDFPVQQIQAVVLR